MTKWPIVVRVYTKQDYYKPFSVAMFAGKGKPADLLEYTRKFIEEINLLLANGVKKKHFNLKLKLSLTRNAL